MKIPTLMNHDKIEFPMDRSHPKHVRIEYIQGIHIYPQNYHHHGLDIDGDQDNDNIADWVEEIATDNWAWFTRGYTGHEMLPEFGLINMNGRAYDPVLGRMLQVDNYIQNPFSSQSYNRYSYVLNNPMKYVDPSGEFIIPLIAGAIIGGYLGGAIQQGSGGLSGGNYNPFGGAQGKWDNTAWTGILPGAIVGAGIGMAIAGGLGAAGVEVAGVTNGFSPGFVGGFAPTGATTIGFDITYNALVTANINILSNVIQGNGWEQTAISGAVGLVAGGIGGTATLRLRSARFPMSFKAIRRQNYVTSILNGAGDRYFRSKSERLSSGQVLSNTLLGATEGLFMAGVINSKEYVFVQGERNPVNFLEKMHFKPNERLTARYLSGIITQAGTSIPGAGFQVAVAYYSLMPGILHWSTHHLGAVFATAFWSSYPLAPRGAFDLLGLWDSYSEIGGFRPYSVYGPY